jgi:SAM-dependent methyltransferase
MNKFESWWEKNLDSDTYVHHNVLYPAPSKETFETWMGDHNEKDRVYVRDFMVEYDSVLDAGCGAAPEHRVIDPEKYHAMDITQKLVDYNVSRGIDCKQGSLMNMPYADNEFDIVLSRHVTEHMKEIETPLREMVRVAKKQVLLSFFIEPIDLDWHHIALDNAGTDGEIYHNQYSVRIIEDILRKSDKVSSFVWRSGLEKTICFLDIGMVR